MSDSRNAIFFDHLEELRRRLLACAAAWLAFFAVAFFLSPTILRFFLREAFRGVSSVDLYFFKPQEAFVLALDIGAIAALVAVVPLIVIQVALFAFPGCTRRERTGLVFAFSSSFVLAVAGTAFGWFFLRPFCLNFFLATIERFSGLLDPGLKITAAIGALSAIRLVLTLVAACAIAFQLPVVLLLLHYLGVVSRASLARGRPYMYIAILVVAAIITPPDVLSQILVAAPLVVLYELTVAVSALFPVRQSPPVR
jgi:sec-independent protein translocase protein TatC